MFDAGKFERWLSQVNKAVNAMTGGLGLDMDDLPDVDYGGMFEDGVTPKAAAREALEDAGFEA